VIRVTSDLQSVGVQCGTAFKIGASCLANARRRFAGRRERDALFGAALFADPAWDVLLYLFIAAGEGRAVSIREACAAASVPETTALRHIAHLKDRGLLQCRTNPSDRRSTHLVASEAAQRKMSLLLEPGGLAGDCAAGSDSSSAAVIRSMRNSIQCAPRGSPKRHPEISARALADPATARAPRREEPGQERPAERGSE
jgi:DNA-binding MarR family transcriptional regulator